jgi:hypothetical protein
MDDLQVLRDLPAALQEKQKEFDRQCDELIADLRALINQVESVLLQDGFSLNDDAAIKAGRLVEWEIRNSAYSLLAEVENKRASHDARNNQNEVKNV